MLIIAHRGLVNGADAVLENDPRQIQQLLDADWHVEIDVRYQNNTWYLGHDVPTHAVDVPFLIQPHLWIHVKDSSAASAIIQLHTQHEHVNYFWHESDARTLTSQGYWWTQPGHELVTNSVAVMPETHTEHVRDSLQWSCVAVCTDWGAKLR